MVRECYLCGYKQNGETNISLHKFPKNEKIRAAWVRACGLIAGVDVIPLSLSICSKHFSAEDFFPPKSSKGKQNIQLLKPRAVPRRFDHTYKLEAVEPEQFNTLEIVEVAQDDNPIPATSSTLEPDVFHTSEISEEAQFDIPIPETPSTPASTGSVVASEQTVETGDIPFPTNIIKVTTGRATRSSRLLGNNASLKPGRHIIGPGSKVVRLVKGGMIVSKKKVKEDPDAGVVVGPSPEVVQVKQEVLDPSPLHELAELSMQHAQNLFKCEMCSELFSDRAQLLQGFFLVK